MLARALVLCLTVSFAAAVLTGCGSRDESGEAAFNRSEVRSLVLAPRDLGRGYTYGDDSFCGGLSPESSSEKFADFVRDADPEACGMEMYYAFRNARATGPARAVQSGAVVLDTADDARRALTLRKELIQYITGESPRDFAGAGDFGPDAATFTNGGFDVPPGVGVVWRNGNMVAVVLAGGLGLDPEQAPQAAMSLAHKQQARIDSRTPRPVATTTDDRELELDNPALEIPVYWLGTEFDPPGSLPRLELYKGRSYPGTGRPEIGFNADLDYRGGVTLNLWKPEAWEKAKSGLPGRLVWSDGCTRATEIKLPRGRAVLYAGYAKPSNPPCPTAKPDLFLAHVFLPGVVVRVNPVLCLYPCSARSPSVRDPYNSRPGIEDVVRGLRLRPQQSD
jgi:hypothetical protein